MNKYQKIEELRRLVTRHGLPNGRPAIPLGHPQADAVLGGGLKPGALHEVYAADWGASGFAALLAVRAAGGAFNGKGGPLFWIRTDYAALEYGAVSPNGLLELGGNPQNLFVVRTARAADALSAASDILACAPVGALLLEIEGRPKALDLVASRRLSFIADESGVPVILLREGAHETPSAAMTRWLVKSAPSRADDDDWGNPVFDAALTRHRLGGLGHFLMQWNPDNACFTPHHGRVAAAPAHRSAPTKIAV